MNKVTKAKIRRDLRACVERDLVAIVEAETYSTEGLGATALIRFVQTGEYPVNLLSILWHNNVTVTSALFASAAIFGDRAVVTDAQIARMAEVVYRAYNKALAAQPNQRPTK